MKLKHANNISQLKGGEWLTQNLLFEEKNTQNKLVRFADDTQE